MNRCLRSQNRLKFSMKFTLCRGQAVESHVFTPSSLLNRSEPQFAGKGPLIKASIFREASMFSSMRRSAFSFSDSDLRMMFTPICTMTLDTSL